MGVGSWSCDVPGKNLLVLEHHNNGFGVMDAVLVRGGGKVFFCKGRAVDEANVPVQEFGVGRGESDAPTHLSAVQPDFPGLGPVQEQFQPTVVQLEGARGPGGTGRGRNVKRGVVGAVAVWCWKACRSNSFRQVGNF